MYFTGSSVVTIGAYYQPPIMHNIKIQERKSLIKLIGQTRSERDEGETFCLHSKIQ